MKKKLVTTLLSLIFGTAYGTTDAVPMTPLDLDIQRPIKEEKRSNSFFYVKMGAGDSHPTNSAQVLPGIGLGYRLNGGNSAIDFSAHYTSGRGVKGDKERAYFLTFPRVSYLRYLSPKSPHSLYGGVGLAWTTLKTKDNRRFNGLTPSATVGYEITRQSRLKTFLQIDVSQPALAESSKGAFPGPVAEASVGFGF